MLQTRIIPVLLLEKSALVKSRKFKDLTYIGDPINAVRIFNDKEVDEIILLDITASKEQRDPNFNLIAEIGSEAFVPFAYGGGIKNISQVRRIMFAGAEKIILNSAFLQNPEIVTEISNYIGSSSTVVSIDIKKNIWGKYKVYSDVQNRISNQSPLELAKTAERLGAGEIFINSVDLDGMMAGYDLNLLQKIAQNINIPVIACGGAGNITHLQDAIKKTNIAAVAAGSMFVFHGKHKAVLINYPDKEKINIIQK